MIRRAPRVGGSRGAILAVVATAQLMVVLDVTVVNIALPSTQRELGLSDAGRQWVITAYTLAFGGFLLAGGRISDRIGRTRGLLVGLTGFAIASAAGGAAANAGTLIAARAAQGLFSALLAPSALALLTTTFTGTKERARAFGVYGAVLAAGGALGLVVGGLCTQYLDWRWCLYLNSPIAVGALIAGLAVLPREDSSGAKRASTGRLGLFDVALGSGSMVALVYLLTEAGAHGWGSTRVWALIPVAIVLLAAFVLRQRRSADPLLPMAVLADRNRAAAFVTIGLTAIGMFGMFLVLTYQLQGIMRYSPLRTGVAMLPMAVAVVLSAMLIAARLLPRLPARVLIVPGLVLSAAGLLVLTRLTPDSTYVTGVLPALLLLGIGSGITLMPSVASTMNAVEPRYTGTVSAFTTTSQQLGGSIGTALLNTIATSATASYAGGRGDLVQAADRARATVHGYAVACGWATGILLLCAVLAGVLINAGPQGEQTKNPDEEASATAENPETPGNPENPEIREHPEIPEITDNPENPENPVRIDTDEQESRARR